MDFQDLLVKLGWLDGSMLAESNEYGTIDELTLNAIYEIQLTFLKDGSYTPVYDADGNVYPIDEATYSFIMNELKKR